METEVYLVQVMAKLGEAAHPASTARHVLRATLREWRVADDLAEHAELAVSELVSNAVEHGAGVSALTLSKDDSTIRIAVADHSEQCPRMWHPRPTEEGHRGLLIVQAVSSDWGYSTMKQGKTVWAEFTLTV